MSTLNDFTVNFSEKSQEKSMNHLNYVDDVLTSKIVTFVSYSKGMFSSIYAYMKKAGKDPYEFIPWTIVINERTRVNNHTFIQRMP